MLAKPTVFILGAGASQPYGFPTGFDLLCDVANSLGASSPSSLREAVETAGYTQSQCLEFATALSLSAMPSIDFFLESRQEFIAIGKAAIAAALIPHEEPHRLHQPGLKGAWYRYLIGQLGHRQDDVLRNEVSFVTFNYDRSLEYFLMTAFKHRWNLSDSDAAGMLGKIPIVHVYGQLGRLPQIPGPGQARAYDPKASGAAIDKAVQGIKIMHEADGLNSGFPEAHRLLSQARCICFLGFGYHRINLDRLGLVARLSDLHKNPVERICGSACGLPRGQRPGVVSAFGGRPMTLDDRNLDVLDFLQATDLFS